MGMKFKESSMNEDGKQYFSLKDGESAVGIFRGDPYDYRKHWVNGHSVPCTDVWSKSPQTCEHCLAGNKAGFAFKVIFVTKVDNQYTPKVWDQGWTVYNQLKELNDSFPLEKTVVRIKRSGSDKNTSYTILPNPNNHVVSPETERTLVGLQLPDLAPKQATVKTEHPSQQQQERDFGPPPNIMTESDLPF